MWLVTRLLRKNVHELDLVVPLPSEETVRHVVRILEREGRWFESTVVAGADDWSTIRVLVSAGSDGLNSLVVTALVFMIRQRAGERTAVRLAAALASSP